jgi:hypothetical protein
MHAQLEASMQQALPQASATATHLLVKGCHAWDVQDGHKLDGALQQTIKNN